MTKLTARHGSGSDSYGSKRMTSTQPISKAAAQPVLEQRFALALTNACGLGPDHLPLTGLIIGEATNRQPFPASPATDRSPSFSTWP